MREFTIEALNHLVSKVKALIAGKQDTLTFDSTPTAGSSNPVTSDGIKTAIDAVVADGVYFTTTYDEATDTTTFNGTLEELQAAFESGKKVYLDGVKIEFVSNAGSGDELHEIEISVQDGILLMSAKITADSVFTVLSVDFLLHTGNLATEISEESTDEEVPTAKTVYDAVNATGKMFVFEVVVALSASGMSLSLPPDVTVADITTQYEAGKHVVAMVDIPSVAGSAAGLYLLPLVKKHTNGELCFASQLGDDVLAAFITVDGLITYTNPRMVSKISASSTNNEYPTAKAVYDAIRDAIQDVNTGFANGESDMYT